jgi:cell fate (sporulation/competence/biofilm development) regulator YmcA (YheA/YmcA/DUF963 family)
MKQEKPINEMTDIELMVLMTDYQQMALEVNNVINSLGAEINKRVQEEKNKQNGKKEILAEAR